MQYRKVLNQSNQSIKEQQKLVNLCANFINILFIPSSFYLTREKLNIKDHYLDAKNHPNLDVITMAFST